MTIRSVLLFLAVPITLIVGEVIVDSAFAQSLPGAKGRSTPVKRMECPLPQTGAWTSMQTSVPTDITGVYDVTVRSAGVIPKGRAKLTVDGNLFVITGDSWSHKGRLVATTTGNYTSAAVAFEQPNQGATSPLYQVVSVRATSTKSGRLLFSRACNEAINLTWFLTADQDKMYDVHFITDPTTKPVNIMTDLKWRQCKHRDEDIKKCPWQAAGEPEKMLGRYHYFVEWSDGRSKKGELEVTNNKSFTITAP